MQSREQDVSTQLPGSDLPAELDWVSRPHVLQYLKDGQGPADTAQVHPELFTKKLLALAEARGGVKVLVGAEAKQIHLSTATNAVASVTYHDKHDATDHHLDASQIIITAGPWSSRLYPTSSSSSTTTAPPIPTDGARSHSIVVAPEQPISPHVLTPLHITDPQGTADDNFIEFYPRPDGTVYICGVTHYDLPLPASTADVVICPRRCDDLLRATAKVAPALATAPVLVKQACYRPYIVGRPRNSHPILGFTSTPNLLVAAGHDEWGIQNSAGTGKLLAEMLLEGAARSADVDDLDPRLVGW